MKDKKTGETMKAAHIIGAFIRLCKLMFFGVRPVFVFDGATPQMKLRTTQERRARKVAAGSQAQKVALRLFRQQLKLAALTAADKAAEEQAKQQNQPRTGPAMAQSDDALTELPEDFVYVNNAGATVPGQEGSPAARGAEAKVKKASVGKRSRTQSKRDQDEYELEDAQPLDTSAVDPRLISEEEMRRFVKKHRQRATNIDIDDAAFRALPLEQQHDIVTDLKNRSRQANHGRLMRMAEASNGDPLSFSSMQIHGLMKRNKLTQKLYDIAKQPGPSTSEAKARAAQLAAAKPTRVASERSRQYMLVKNDPTETGFTIRSSRVASAAALPTGGHKSAPKVIDVDRFFDEQEGREEAKGAELYSELSAPSDNSLEEDEDWEDVELPSANPITHPSCDPDERALTQVASKPSSNFVLDDEDVQLLEALRMTSAAPPPENGDYFPDDMPIEDIEAAFAAAEAGALENGVDGSATFADRNQENRMENSQSLPGEKNQHPDTMHNDDDTWEKWEDLSRPSLPNPLQQQLESGTASFDWMDRDGTYGDVESVSSLNVDTPAHHFFDYDELMQPQNRSFNLNSTDENYDLSEQGQVLSSPLSIYADPRNYARENIAAQEIRELIDEGGASGEAAEIIRQDFAIVRHQRRRKEPEELPPLCMAGPDVLQATAQEVLKCTRAEDAEALWLGIASEAFEEVYPDFLERTHRVLGEWDLSKLEEESARIHKIAGKQPEGSTQAQIHEIWRTVVAVSLEWRLTRAKNLEQENTANDEQYEVHSSFQLSGLPKRMQAQSERSTPTTESGPETPFNGVTPVNGNLGNLRKKRVSLFKVLRTSGPNSPEHVIVSCTDEEGPIDAADLVFSTDASPEAVDSDGYYFTVTDKATGLTFEQGAASHDLAPSSPTIPLDPPFSNEEAIRPEGEPHANFRQQPRNVAGGLYEKDSEHKEEVPSSEVPASQHTSKGPHSDLVTAPSSPSLYPAQIQKPGFTDPQLEIMPSNPPLVDTKDKKEPAQMETRSRLLQLSPVPSLPSPVDQASLAGHLSVPPPAPVLSSPLPANQASPKEHDASNGSFRSDLDATQSYEPKSPPLPFGFTASSLAKNVDTVDKTAVDLKDEAVPLVPDEIDTPYDNDCIEIEDEETNVDVPTEMSAEMEENARFFAQITNSSREEVARDLEEDVISLNRQKRKHETNAAELSTDMTKDLQAMTRMFGIPYITAPMEAEAQCAWLLSNKLVDGIVSEDSDGWLFGAQKLLKNIFNQQKYVEEYTMERITNMMALDREKLVQLAYLLGSDYTPGIQGIGPTLGLEVLNMWRGSKLEPLQKFREWWEMVYADPSADAENDNLAKKKLRKILKEKPVPALFPDERVWDAYFNPQVDKDMRPFEWGEPRLDELRDFMEEKAEWSQTKVDQYLIPIIKERQRIRSGVSVPVPTQTSLDRFFSGIGNGKTSHKSARIQSIVEAWKTGGTASPPLPRKRRASGNADEQDNPASAPKRARKAKCVAPEAPEGATPDEQDITGPTTRKRKSNNNAVPEDAAADELGSAPPTKRARKSKKNATPADTSGTSQADAAPTPISRKRKPARVAPEGSDAPSNKPSAKVKRITNNTKVAAEDELREEDGPSPAQSNRTANDPIVVID
ncbi:DNA repair protein rad2 [Geranomyces michiganensis]|nr:DNA repair protein rad2 [Geranomyces michiganensis]